jgi:hypothetical protein
VTVARTGHGLHFIIRTWVTVLVAGRRVFCRRATPDRAVLRFWSAHHEVAERYPPAALADRLDSDVHPVQGLTGVCVLAVQVYALVLVHEPFLEICRIDVRLHLGQPAW